MGDNGVDSHVQQAFRQGTSPESNNLLRRSCIAFFSALIYTTHCFCFAFFEMDSFVLFLLDLRLAATAGWGGSCALFSHGGLVQRRNGTAVVVHRMDEPDKLIFLPPLERALWWGRRWGWMDVQ